MSQSRGYISDEVIRATLAPYGCVPNQGQCDSLRTYIDLLLRWNRRVSLTTVTEPLEILRFHIGESVSAIRLVPLTQGRLADVGSGAGFPGAVLALFAQSLNVTLIESNTKKATFLAEIQRTLNLANLRIFRGRLEAFAGGIERFEFVTSRAVGSYESLLSWSTSILSPSGLAILWVSEGDSQVISQSDGWSWRKTERFPASKNRILLIGQRITQKKR